MLTLRFFVSHLQIKDNNDLTGGIPAEVNRLHYAKILSLLVTESVILDE
jgi:hypothetical protein